MPLAMIPGHVLIGWCFWSLAHNLGHRWWHDEMKKGKETFYAHGERQHHRLYDSDDLVLAKAEDPLELFISFPAAHIAVIAAIPVAAYFWFFGWPAAALFATGLYVSLIVDHQLHRRFHAGEKLPGVVGRLQEMHSIHHATHSSNFFFASGIVWDVAFRTAIYRREQLPSQK